MTMCFINISNQTQGQGFVLSSFLIADFYPIWIPKVPLGRQTSNSKDRAQPEGLSLIDYYETPQYHNTNNSARF